MIYLSFVAIALLWGTSYIAIKSALTVMTAMELLAIRWSIAFLFFLLLYAFKIVKIDYRGKKLSGLVLLVLFQPCLYALFETIGVDLTSSSESSIFIGVIPLMVVLEGWIIFRKKVSKKLLLAIVTAFAGLLVSIIFAPDFATGGKFTGYLVLLCAITVGGMYCLITNKVSETFSFIEITFGMALGGAVWFNILSLLSGNGISPYLKFAEGGVPTLAVIYLGLGCSFLAYILYNYALSRITAATASCLQTNLITIVGVVAGIAVGGDSWGWYTVVGVIMMSIGVFMSASEEKEL